MNSSMSGSANIGDDVGSGCVVVDLARTVALAAAIMSFVGHIITNSFKAKSPASERRARSSVNQVVRLLQSTGLYPKILPAHAVNRICLSLSPYTNRLCLSKASTGLRVATVRMDSAVLMEWTHAQIERSALENSTPTSP